MASILLGAARAVNTEVADCVHFLRDPSNSLLSKAAKAITKLALPLIAAATIGFIAGAAVGSPLLGCCIAVLTASLLLAYAMRSAWGTLPSQQGSQINPNPPASPSQQGQQISAKPPASPSQQGQQISAKPPASPSQQGQQISAKAPASPSQQGSQISAKAPASLHAEKEDAELIAKAFAPLQQALDLGNRRRWGSQLAEAKFKEIGCPGHDFLSSVERPATEKHGPLKGKTSAGCPFVILSFYNPSLGPSYFSFGFWVAFNEKSNSFELLRAPLSEDGKHNSPFAKKTGGRETGAPCHVTDDDLSLILAAFGANHSYWFVTQHRR